MQNYNSKFKSNLIDRCFNFSLRIIALLDILPNKRSSWVIGDQLMRSATSVGANLTEGKAASSRLEFKKYYEIALKSANETKYWLGLLNESSLADGKMLNPLQAEITEIANMLASAVIKLKQK